MWNQVTPWLGVLGMAATLGGVLYPFMRAKNREAQDKAADALATTQAHRIATLEGERDDLRKSLDLEHQARLAAESKAAERLAIIERAIRHD
jgi:hypothetical protein